MKQVKKYRIGNDIPVTWKILTNGERASLENRNIMVTCHDAFGQEVPVEWTVVGCEVHATIRGKNQRATGLLTMKCVENDGGDDMATLDVRLVELVAHSWLMDGCPTDDVILVTSSVETSLSVTEVQKFREIARLIPQTMAHADDALQACMMRHAGGDFNMNNALENGFYFVCNSGRPLDSSDGETYALMVLTAGSRDGAETIFQICMSNIDAQRIYTRKIITTDRSNFEPPTTVYEDWRLVGCDIIDSVTALAGRVTALEDVSVVVTTEETSVAMDEIYKA